MKPKQHLLKLRTLGVIAMIGATSQSLQAKIEVTGTAAQQKAINDAIERIKKASKAGKECFEALEKHPKKVTISFGQTSDIATAHAGRLEVKLNKTAIDCLKQINNDKGDGKALEASSLDLIIVHEALGHLHNFVKGNAWGEPAAMAKTNKVRSDMGLPTRTSYARIDEDGNVVADFSDGSKLDATAALQKPRAAAAEGGSKGERKKFTRFGQQAVVNVAGQFDPQSNLWQMQLNPEGGPQTMQLDLGQAGGNPQEVEILGLQLTATHSESEEFPIEVLDFELVFDSFEYQGEETGVNKVSLMNEGRGGVGFGDLEGNDEAAGFQAEGDYILSNPLFESQGFEGYTVQNLDSMFRFDPEFGMQFGQAFLNGVYFTPDFLSVYGDFDENGLLDVSDLNAITEAIRSGSHNESLDVNGDGSINLEDARYWVMDLKQSFVGDSNFDGEFDSNDLIRVFQGGKYESDEFASWQDGDWNFDGLFDSQDVIAVFAGGLYETGPRTGPVTVPEPNSMAVIFSGIASVIAGYRRRHG